MCHADRPFQIRTIDPDHLCLRDDRILRDEFPIGRLLCGTILDRHERVVGSTGIGGTIDRQTRDKLLEHLRD